MLWFSVLRLNLSSQSESSFINALAALPVGSLNRFFFQLTISLYKSFIRFENISPGMSWYEKQGLVHVHQVSH